MKPNILRLLVMLPAFFCTRLCAQDGLSLTLDTAGAKPVEFAGAEIRRAHVGQEGTVVVAASAEADARAIAEWKVAPRKFAEPQSYAIRRAVKNGAPGRYRAWRGPGRRDVWRPGRGRGVPDRQVCRDERFRSSAAHRAARSSNSIFRWTCAPRVTRIARTPRRQNSRKCGAWNSGTPFSTTWRGTVSTSVALESASVSEHRKSAGVSRRRARRCVAHDGPRSTTPSKSAARTWCARRCSRTTR